METYQLGAKSYLQQHMSTSKVEAYMTTTWKSGTRESSITTIGTISDAIFQRRTINNQNKQTQENRYNNQ